MAIYLSKGLENNKEINEKNDQVALSWKADVSACSPIQVECWLRQAREEPSIQQVASIAVTQLKQDEESKRSMCHTPTT